MSFFNRIGNWLQTTGRKVFNGIRGGVATGFNAVQNVAHKIGSAASGIDNLLTQARTIPVVGELASKLQAHPYYMMAKEGIETANKVIDKAGDIGGEVGKVLDAALPQQ
jgi:hypothetical protein